MKLVKAIIQPFKLAKVCAALHEVEGLPGMTVDKVHGWGRSRAINAPGATHFEGCAFVRKVMSSTPDPSQSRDL